MADYNGLRLWLKTLAAESCLKIGVTLPGLQLNEPRESLCRLLKVSPGELERAAEDFPGLYQKGDVIFSWFEENSTLKLNAKAVLLAKQELGENPFLRSLVKLSQAENSTAEDFHHLMKEYGQVQWDHAPCDEFDYLGYFVDGKPDDFRYCFCQEGKRCDYHRYTREDFDAFAF